MSVDSLLWEETWSRSLRVRGRCREAMGVEDPGRRSSESCAVSYRIRCFVASRRLVEWVNSTSGRLSTT